MRLHVSEKNIPFKDTIWGRGSNLELSGRVFCASTKTQRNQLGCSDSNGCTAQINLHGNPKTGDLEVVLSFSKGYFSSKLTWQAGKFTFFGMKMRISIYFQNWKCGDFPASHFSCVRASKCQLSACGLARRTVPFLESQIEAWNNKAIKVNPMGGWDFPPAFFGFIMFYCLSSDVKLARQIGFEAPYILFKLEKNWMFNGNLFSTKGRFQLRSSYLNKDYSHRIHVWYIYLHEWLIFMVSM